MPKQTSADSTRRRERKRTIIEIATTAHRERETSRVIEASRAMLRRERETSKAMLLREREGSRAMLLREREASKAMLRKAKEANVEIIDKTTIAVVTTETEVSADKANALKTTAHKVSVSKANDLKATIVLNLSKANKKTIIRENKK